MTAPDLYTQPLTLEEALRLHQRLRLRWPDAAPPRGHPDYDLFQIILNVWHMTHKLNGFREFALPF